MRHLVASIERDRKFVSELVALEVRSAIRRRERLDDLKPADVEAALASLASEQMELMEEQISPAILEQAALIIDRHALRALDSLQLATAFGVRTRLAADEVWMVAGDVRLLKAAMAEGFPVWNPGASASWMTA